MRTELLDTDVLVVGGGAAGLCAALQAAPRRVLIITPELHNSSCTELARGGIAAPVAPGDSVALHVADTLRAGAHSSAADTSQHIISAAGSAVEFLQSCGVQFDRHDSDGSLDLHLEAGHAIARILHADGDATGAAIHAALLQHALQSPHITWLSGAQATTLLNGPQGIAGVNAISGAGTPLLIRAAETVLATGGIGQLFAHTTNGPHAVGAGLAMALEAGAAVSDLEFVQFHPTALQCAQDPLPLLTEALRGAGAVLVNSEGQRFMQAVDERAELAPRDIVARAVWQQQHQGLTVLLDARRIFAEHPDAFPAALAACRAHGMDPSQQPIPITCAAHFHMGGVQTDMEGRTSLPGLWACGEVACTGFHGANRLASNSLLEAVVMGRAVGQAIAHSAHAQRNVDNTASRLDADRPPDPAIDSDHDSGQVWSRLRELMWQSMGPIRCASDLQHALLQIEQLQKNPVAHEWPLCPRLLLAAAMIRAALQRTESRGAHWRSDFPHRNSQLDWQRSHAAAISRKHAAAT